MEKILNVTNGDATVDLMRQAAVPGDFLPWRDVLHEGPVPDGLSLRELSVVRSWFIARQGWTTHADARQKFTSRDNALLNFTTYDRLILWFESDLYDQLQLIQILAWLLNHDWGRTEIFLIQDDGYLGMLEAEDFIRLQKTAQPVSSEQFLLASEAWQAFSHHTPEKIVAIARRFDNELPFLCRALQRLLEEYPNRGNGLSRTEEQLLQAVADGLTTPIDIFNQTQAQEEYLFMGDIVFWSKLNSLADGEQPLLMVESGRVIPENITHQQVTITDYGNAVLSEQENIFNLRPIDRWIGGVHLHNDAPYCFDPDTGDCCQAW